MQYLLEKLIYPLIIGASWSRVWHDYKILSNLCKLATILGKRFFKVNTYGVLSFLSEHPRKIQNLVL